MFQRLRSYFDKLLCDNGPSSSRLINIGVFIVLSIAMLKLTWTCKEEPGEWYFYCFTTLAVYGMGVANFSKWLDILKIRAGGKVDPQ